MAKKTAANRSSASTSVRPMPSPTPSPSQSMTVKVLVEDPVAKAEAEVEQLVEYQLRTWQARQAKASEVASRGAVAGDALVDAALKGVDAGPGQDAGRIALAHAELVVLDEALDSARRRHQAAIPAIWRAQAAGMRMKAAARRAEAAEHEVLTLRLLDQLREHEGVSYEPSRTIPPERLVGGDLRGGALQTFIVNLPRTILMRQEADALEQTAGNIERQEVHQAGQVVGVTVDDLVAAVLANPSVIGPRPVDIASWAAEAEKRERQRRIRLAHGGADALGYAPPAGPLEFVLTWRRGAIDLRESGARPPDPEPVAFEDHRPAPEKKVAAAPAEKVVRRPSSSRSPFDTSATPAEIANEAAVTPVNRSLR